MARFYLSMVLLGFLFPTLAQQQSLLSTAGGFYQNNDISVSWSLGESITETFGNETYTVTQGFQQSQLGPVGVLEPKKLADTGFEVYPNPTHGLVKVKFNRERIVDQDVPDRYSLFNIHGRLLAVEAIPEDPLLIDLAPYSGAVYYLRLYNSVSKTQFTVIIQKIN